MKLKALVLGVLLAGLPAPAYANHGGPHPDSINQPVTDGCGRDPLELITTGRTPQWVYVNKDPTPKYFRGTVAISRPTETDNFRQHSSYDMNWNLKPDSGYESFLSTANLTQEGDEQNTMHNEWEQNAYPLFAWPTTGDSVEMIGSWIWDCGHWSDPSPTDPQQFPLYLAPGTQPSEAVTGEKTEFHPPRMVVVHREVPSVSEGGGAVTDAIISSNGTMARAIEDKFSGVCTQPLSELCSQWSAVNDRDYEFDIQAPPKPKGASQIKYQVKDQGSKNAPEAQVNTTSTGVHVRVPFKGWGNSGDEMVFAKTIAVGWESPRRVHHYRVALKSLEWVGELDGPDTGSCLEDIPPAACTGQPQSSAPPDEVNFYVDIAGQWRQIKPDGLLAAKPGDKFALSDSFDVYLAGSTWRVLGRARECDQPIFAECAVQEAGFNNDAGISDQKFTSGEAIAGTYTRDGKADDCQRTENVCFRFTYQVEDLGTQLSDRLLATTGSPSWIRPAGIAALIAGLALIFLLIRRFRPGTSSMSLT